MHSYQHYCHLAIIGLLAFTSQFVAADEPMKNSNVPTYWEDIRPVLRKNCAFCHAERHLKKMDVSAGLALDTYEAILKGGKIPVMKVGDSKNSLLVQLLVSDNPNRRMPLDGDPLAKEQVELLRRWIDTGAKEGKRPADDGKTIVKTSPGKRRRLDVTFATTITPPAGVFGKTPPAPLALKLKVGPLAPVTAVTFSPDGKFLAMASYGQVTVWDLQEMQPVKVLTSFLGAVNDLQFSPDSDILAIGGGQPSAKGELRLYNVKTWQPMATFRDHYDVVFSVSFSPDGKTLATASFDQAVRLWDVKNLKPAETIKGHSDFVYAVAFSPLGDKLASVSKDRTLRITNAKTAEGIFTLSEMEEDVLAVAYHPDGKQVVSSGFETGLYWWDTETGEKTALQRGHGIAVHELAFSKDGKTLVSASADSTIRTWNGITKALVRTIRVGTPVYSVAISPDSKWLASGSFDGQVRIWDNATGKQLLSFVSASAEDGNHPWLVMTPQGYLLASDSTQKIGQWTMRGQTIAQEETVWQALQKSEMLVQALQNKNLPNPTFKK